MTVKRRFLIDFEIILNDFYSEGVSLQTFLTSIISSESS